MIRVSETVCGVACVFGAFMLQFSLAGLYTFGNISTYIASYLKYRTANSWVTNGDMVWILGVTIFMHSPTMYIGVIVEKMVPPGPLCLIGGWTMSLGSILTYFSLKHSLLFVILTYGLLYGLGSGITYSVALTTAMKWFPKHQGFVAGIVVSGYGFGSLVFNIIHTQFINPSNISPNSSATIEKYFTDPLVLDNVPLSFVLMGIIYASIQLVGALCLKNPRGKSISTTEIRLTYDTCTDAEGEDLSNAPYRTLLRAKWIELVILWTTFLCNGIFIVTITSLYKSFGQTFMSNDHYFSVVGAIAAFFNATGRIFWGRLIDIFSYKSMMITLTILMGFLAGTFYFCSMIKSELGVQIIYGTWVSLLFLCLSGNFSILPAAVSLCFGSRNIMVVYGIIYTGYTISSIVGALLISSLLHIIQYWGVFLMSAIAVLISLLLTQCFPSTYATPKTSIDHE